MNHKVLVHRHLGLGVGPAQHWGVGEVLDWGPVLKNIQAWVSMLLHVALYRVASTVSNFQFSYQHHPSFLLLPHIRAIYTLVSVVSQRKHLRGIQLS